ncbi:glycosyltransferase [Microbacterium jejuense]|uniref:glycosyltransferase n=1 Tax=Microbacterium jejuense TaxID=1263637 RepID=UPI0031E5FEA1
MTWLPRKLKNAPRALRRLRAERRSASKRSLPETSAPEAPRYFVAAGPRPTPERVATPDVSVVIPVYNSEPWLDDCLSSVLAQTGITVEVICINDGSTDQSRHVLQRYADEDPRLSIIDQPNSGQSVGRNAGLDVAAGRYLVYLDSDDFWPGDTLKTLVSKADEEHLDVLLFDCFAFRDGDVSSATWARYSTYYQRSREYDLVRPGAEMMADMRRHRDYRPHVGMYIARTDYVRRSGARFIPGIVHQDNPYTFALLLGAERTAHVKSDIYARRIRPGSTITTLDDERSAKGYYLSYVAMTREVDGRTFSPYVTDMLSEVVYGVFEGAQKRITVLPAGAITLLKSLDGSLDAQIALRAMMSARGRSRG